MLSRRWKLAAMAVGLLAVGTARLSLWAHETDTAFAGLSYADGFDAQTVPDGQNPTRAKLAYVVLRMGTLAGVDGRTLLPPGTVLDDVTFNTAGEPVVWLTLGDGAGHFQLSERQAAVVDSVLAETLSANGPIGGLSVRMRPPGGDYRPLNGFVPRAAVPELDPADTAARWIPDPPAPDTSAQSLGGPITSAAGQPVGALTGVVIFCNAGHGWSAGSSSWSLDRPLLFAMNEDHGNLDQLNAFVHHAYNAGATVVPFRPAGFQPIAVVLDNDDSGVSYTGTWNSALDTPKYYENGVTNSGVRYRYATAGPTATAIARYTPTIPVSDFYPVYCWTPVPGERNPVTQTYRITHSGGVSGVSVDHRRVGRGWVYLGTYYFEAGIAGHVEILSQSPNTGVAIADAIRFGVGMGDVVGAGPGTISGKPRDEEASRYWAESELGINARGFSSTIWDCCPSDSSDNVGTAARWSREMNATGFNNDRWRRIYIEFHSNAASGTAKGTVGLYNEGSGGTQNQYELARRLSEKLEADMLALDDQFEFNWGSRNPNTYHASFDYGAINTAYNGDEFDATILEVAFHDNAEDAANMRNAKVRNALARSTVQGIVEFLSDATLFPGTQVPHVFAPDAPEALAAAHDAAGHIVLTWTPGPARPGAPAGGDPATGFRIYRSSNGYGFGAPVDVGNVNSAVLSDIPADTTVYLRVAATNAGGESMPTPTLAVRRPAAGPSRVLLVNGYDRVGRQQNPTQQIPAGTIERIIPRKINSFDYAVQHARSLEAAGRHFDACDHQAVIDGTVSLANYTAIVWMLGQESTTDRTLDSTEQALLTAYLNSGGRLLVTGSEIGFELDGQNAGRSFYETMLRADYVADNAGTYTVTGAGILADVGTFNFNPASGAAYAVPSADRIAPRSGASTIASYSGGGGGAAAVLYDAGTYRAVMFGFPFETISSGSARDAVMLRLMDFLAPLGCPAAPDVVSQFEGYGAGAQVTFMNPRYSPATSLHLATTGSLAATTNEIAPFDGAYCEKVQWSWVDADPKRWLRLVTADAPNAPNPAIDLRRPVRLRLRFDGPEGSTFRLCLGISETGVDVPVGQDGGQGGTIEWVGAGSVVNRAPQGILVAALPGQWQTLTFLPRPGQVQPYTGDGGLFAPFDKGVLEHLAFAAVNSPGPFAVYIDGIDQPCSPPADFDRDGDVDMQDFGYLQGCLSGVGEPITDSACQAARLDADADVDDFDLRIFLDCFSGDKLPADPACDSD